MRISRISVRGFGALKDLELAWPEGRMLLVVDPNETGKTTLCEAVVAALYGLPRGRVAGTKARERRRPRGGAPLAVGVEVETAGRRLTAERDLDRGALRVTEEGGRDVTDEFTTGARDDFGERVTGLTEPLFRTTAYVAQNVLDADELSRGLTLELARIADSGGGEATVVRALDALEAATARMPDAISGPTVSIATELLRLGKRVDERKAELAMRREVRESVLAAAAELRERSGEAEARARRAALLEVATVETERRQVAERLEALEELARTREELAREADRLAADAGGFTRERLEEIARLERERGGRPGALARARRELAESERRDAAAAAAARQELGALAALDAPGRERLDAHLAELAAARSEEEEAEAGVTSAWGDLESEGIAEDLRRIEALSDGDRAFLAGSADERHSLELDGVKCDRRAAESLAAAGLAVGERRGILKRGRGLLAAAACVGLAGLGLLASPTPRAVGSSFVAVGVALGLAGGLVTWRGSRHLVGEEKRRRDDEAAARRQAAEVRKRLSELRSRLDRIARGAGFGEGPALARALRRVRTAEPKRSTLLGRTARRDGARERIGRTLADLEAFRLETGPGVPSPEAVREMRQRLAHGAKAFQELDARAAGRAEEKERLAREEAEVTSLEGALARLLAEAGTPRLLPLAESLLLAEGARAHLARRREILEVELPARGESDEAGRAELRVREGELAGERDRRLAELGASAAELDRFATPEDARRAAEGARREASGAQEARRRAAKAVASRMKEGGERAREAGEELFDLEEALRRALLHRDALREAREGLARAAATAYADFRRGLADASREILATWEVPYAGLDFDDRLAVSAVLRDGRTAAPEEIATGFSTGAREQIHLTARLAALRYLGTGARGVPLLLDDPLVAADDARFVSVMRFLVRHVLSERPVLVVSCHGWRHEQLLARLDPEEREMIAVASLHPSRRSIDGAKGHV